MNEWIKVMIVPSKLRAANESPTKLLLRNKYNIRHTFSNKISQFDFQICLHSVISGELLTLQLQG